MTSSIDLMVALIDKFTDKLARQQREHEARINDWRVNCEEVRRQLYEARKEAQTSIIGLTEKWEARWKLDTEKLTAELNSRLAELERCQRQRDYWHRKHNDRETDLKAQDAENDKLRAELTELQMKLANPFVGHAITQLGPMLRQMAEESKASDTPEDLG